MMSQAGDKHRVRSAALLWTAIVLVVYFGYIALSVYRSRH